MVLLLLAILSKVFPTVQQSVGTTLILIKTAIRVNYPYFFVNLHAPPVYLYLEHTILSMTRRYKSTDLEVFGLCLDQNTNLWLVNIESER